MGDEDGIDRSQGWGWAKYIGVASAWWTTGPRT